MVAVDLEYKSKTTLLSIIVDVKLVFGLLLYERYMMYMRGKYIASISVHNKRDISCSTETCILKITTCLQDTGIVRINLRLTAELFHMAWGNNLSSSCIVLRINVC